MIKVTPMSEAKILVTDDEEDIREVVADRLSHWGYDVIEAVDGVDCLEKLETFDADLLVLDLRMPRMDGLTVLRTLRDRGSTIPVLILSASSEANIAEDTVMQGAAAYMLKPFDPENLKETVAHLLAGESK